MKVFSYILLWCVIFVTALTVRVFLDDFLNSVGISKVIVSLIKSISSGIWMLIGVNLQKKLKVHFDKKANIS